MKITFEGNSFRDILDQMQDVLDLSDTPRATPGPDIAAVEAKLRAPWPAPVDKPVEKQAAKPPIVEQKRVRTEKQLANDEKLRERAQAKKAAGIKPFTKAAPKSDPVLPPPPPPPATAESLGLDPNEVVNLRNRPITDLPEAYANGHQQEVFELLSRFGNGAKSFRELPPESFVPISEAISKGALT